MLPKLMQFQGQTSLIENDDNYLIDIQSRTNGQRRVKIPSFLVQTIGLMIVFLAAGLDVRATQLQEWHSLADIRDTAATFVKSRASKPGQNTTVTAGELDNRLRLHRCAETLEAYLPPGARVTANMTVGVRCASPRQWKLFVPVRVGVAAHVWVASKALPAGKVLTDIDFISQERDLGSLHGGYIRAGESVSGMVLRRRLPEGQPLRNELLTAPNAVVRGQQVTLRSGSRGSTLNIRMAGTALGNGRVGQRIQVKNRSSGRTLEGVVRSSEVVQIGD